MAKQHQRYSDISDYLKKAINGDGINKLCTLRKLLNLCNNDIDEAFRRAIVPSGLVNKLIDCLEIPNIFFDDDRLATSDLRYKSVIFPLEALLGLQCIQSFCSIRSHYHQFVDANFLLSIVKYLSPDGKFFQFGHQFKNVLNIFVSSSKIKVSSNLGKCYDDYSELKFYEPELSNIKDVQMKAKNTFHVELDNSVCDVRDYLITAGVAWEKCQDFAASENEISELNKKWKDCQIKNVLNGNFFWCFISSEAADTFSKVCQSIKASELKKEIPHKGDVILGDLSNDQDLSDVCRCRVVDVAGGIVSLFAVDLGVRKNVTINSIFALPTSLSLENIPATASLARVKGILPPPLYEDALELALASLFAVCKPSVQACDLLMKTDILEQLPTFILSSHLPLANQALRLAAGLASSRAYQCCNKWLRLIYATLICLDRRYQSEKNYHLDKAQKKGSGRDFNHQENRDLILSGLILLANRIYMCRNAKVFFYQSQGLDVVLNIMSLDKLDAKMIELTTVVLNNFVHICRNMDTRKRLVNAIRFTNFGRSGIVSLGEDVKKQGVLDTPVRKAETIFEAVAFQEDQECTDEDDGDTSEMSVSHNRLSLYSSTCSDEENVDLRKGNVNNVYEIDSFVTFRTDASRELYQMSTGFKLNDFGKIICGMLNTGQTGTIYIGISPDGKVLGEVLNHDQRDEMRLGIDRLMMDKITPTVLHSQFRVRFVQVVSYRGDMRVDNADNMVVEITMNPVPKVSYCFKKDSTTDQCFYRTGSSNRLLNQQDVRNMIVITEELWYKRNILELQEKLSELKTVESML